MQSIQGHSAACCNIPPIISKGYEKKGRYETIGGLKTYVTGPSSAKRAILVIYDIFGYFPQTIQGADILASSSKEHSYQVFMPDFFEGEAANIAWYPPDTEDKQKSLYGWFSTRGPSIGVERTPKILNDIEKLYGKKTWGAVGYCWGAKVIALTSGPDTPFSAAAHAHPGLIDTQNAERISIPTCMLASKDETAEEVTAWGRALKVEKHVETFDSQIHGWMSARADLEDEKVKSEYVRGYKLFLEFFAKYL